MYATADKGEGYVVKIGEYDSFEEIEIRIGMFDENVVISFNEESEVKN